MTGSSLAAIVSWSISTYTRRLEREELKAQDVAKNCTYAYGRISPANGSALTWQSDSDPGLNTKHGAFLSGTGHREVDTHESGRWTCRRLY